MEIALRSSPNFGPRRDGLRPELVVLHHTAMLTAEAALDRLCDPAAEVSAHYLVAEDGRVWRLVDEDMRAWHAGAGSWAGRGDVNSRSIGIELANAGPLAGFPPFPEPQMVALERLLDAILPRWSIPPAGVIAHSDLAPGRKADPGPKFDWRRLARGGRALWAEPPPPPARPTGRPSPPPPRPPATRRPTATGRSCSRRCGCAGGPGRSAAGAGGAPTWRRSRLALTGGRLPT